MHRGPYSRNSESLAGDGNAFPPCGTVLSKGEQFPESGPVLCGGEFKFPDLDALAQTPANHQIPVPASSFSPNPDKLKTLAEKEREREREKYLI